MKIYCDMITGSEYFSDAKKVESVEWKDPESGEPVATGLVRVVAVKQTQGGVKIAGVGGGGSSGFEGGEKEGGDEEDAGEEAEETKLDQFWTFPDIENEHNFGSFAEFKKNYFMPYLVAWQKMSVEKGLAKDAAEMKAKGKQMADGLSKWIKAHFDELQFFGPEAYYMDGGEVDEKFSGQGFAPNLAFVKYEDVTPYFYFVVDAFKVVRQ